MGTATGELLKIVITRNQAWQDARAIASEKRSIEAAPMRIEYDISVAMGKNDTAKVEQLQKKLAEIDTSPIQKLGQKLQQATDLALFLDQHLLEAIQEEFKGELPEISDQETLCLGVRTGWQIVAKSVPRIKEVLVKIF